MKIKFSFFIRIIALSVIFFAGSPFASANGSPPPKLKLKNLTWSHHSSGIRSYNFVDVYRCTLYFRNKIRPVASINNLQHPIVIRIEILTSMLPDKMPDVWRETIESEVTGKAFRRFKKGFSNLDEGDVLLFMYLPGEATRLFLNGKLLFTDPGQKLMQALLDQWVGSYPVSEDLKQALLGE